jgi:hypothetical protein
LRASLSSSLLQKCDGGNAPLANNLANSVPGPSTEPGDFNTGHDEDSLCHGRVGAAGGAGDAAEKKKTESDKAG